MSNDMNQLEHEIRQDRSMLEQTLGQLTTALSPERISSTVAREIDARGGALGQTAMDMARANPAAMLLVGAGVAALLAGPRKPNPEPPYDVRARQAPAGTLQDDTLTAEFDRRVAAADAAMDAEPRAPKLRAALNSGLANLPEPARRRVIKAREAAIDAQEKIDRQAEIAKRKARSFHQRQPLSTGAVALGIGAILAAVLPRTRVEDDLMGAQRDALMQQAELTLRDEIARARATGEAALREGLEAGKQRVSQH